MKKNYVYFIAPLAGLAVFTAVYWQYASGYDARMVEMHRQEVQAAQKKLDEDAANRVIAAKAAFAAQEKRKAEKKLKDAHDAEEKDKREKAVDAMHKAQNDSGKLTSRVKSLTKEIDGEKKEIAKLDEDKKSLIAEEAFQRSFVKQAQDNRTALLATLDKVEVADKKWDEAQKEAAKAATTKK